MGKLIICSGKQATNPYLIKLTNTRIYTIEELCYYIYNNIDAINEDFFGDDLITWMSDELVLADRAGALQGLLRNNAGLKDIVVYILCSADYYSEMEMKQLLHTIDELAFMTPTEKMKKKADNYLKYRQYTQAATEYEHILNGKEAANLSREEYGNLLHNLAVAQLNTIGIHTAAESFKEAYERNHNIESLKQYLLALKLSKQEDRFQTAILEYHINQALQQQIQNEMDTMFLAAENQEVYQKVRELEDCKQSGKINQYYQIAGELIDSWKQEFRNENY